MGYYTRYSLQADPWPDGLGEAIRRHGQMRYCLGEDGSSPGIATWYEHVRDMKAFSLRFPGVRFTLHAEAGELWDKHFLDGRVQVCRAEFVIPPFDPAKLE